MDSYLDTWTSGNAPLSKSITRDTLQSTSASNIIGRKLNSYFKVPKKSPDSGRPLIIEQMQNSTTRFKSSSKSPLRSSSSKSIKALKNLESTLKKLDSPPRQSSRGLSTRRTNIKAAAHGKKLVINDQSNMILKEKSENLKKTVENNEKKQNLREKLEKTNRKIREINSKSLKKHSKSRINNLPDKKPKHEDARSSSRENDELRAKTRPDRDTSNKTTRRTQEFPQIKEKKKPKKSPNHKKKPQKNSENQKIFENSTKEKFLPSKSQKFQENPKNLEFFSKEKEKNHVFDKTCRKKSSKICKKLKKTEDVGSSFLAISSSKKQLKVKLKKKQNFRISSDLFTKKLKVLQERVNLKYDLMMVESVIKIQRWFRRLLRKSHPAGETSYSFENCLPTDNEWVSFLNTSHQEDDFSMKFNSRSLKPEEPEEYFDSLSSNNPSVFKFKSNPSSFQLKRPTQLNLDCIINPLVSPEILESESSNLLSSNSANIPISPTFNKSLYKSNESQKFTDSSQSVPEDYLKTPESSKPFTEDSCPLGSEMIQKALNQENKEPELQISKLESSEDSQISKLSQVFPKSDVTKDPELSSCSISNQSEIKESQASILSKKAESVENSLEKDISELSSALVKSSLNHSGLQEEKPESPSNSMTSYKIPISSPDLSSSISDLVQDFLEKELKIFLSSIKFKLKEKEVDSSPAFIEVFLRSLFEELDKNEEEFLELANTPSFIDPLAKLALLQNTDVGELPKRPNLEIVLPAEIGSYMKNKLASKVKAREVYVTMMFDCVNEALNHVRPFGLKGVPDPWICEPRLLFGEGELRRVFKKIKNVLEAWDSIRGGVFGNFDCLVEEEDLQAAREERMSKLLCFDVNSEEVFWVDYEDEETQSKMDLADLILDGLLKETALLLN